jgi:peptidoglycan/xylan/chitin deacetylase (PgdA/CDA1 family)
MTVMPAVSNKECACSLEDTFGVAVIDFAYPGGSYDERILELVQEAGYSAAVTTEFGVNDAATNAYKLRRISAYRSFREALTYVAETYATWRRDKRGRLAAR